MCFLWIFTARAIESNTRELIGKSALAWQTCLLYWLYVISLHCGSSRRPWISRYVCGTKTEMIAEIFSFFWLNLSWKDANKSATKRYGDNKIKWIYSSCEKTSWISVERHIRVEDKCQMGTTTTKYHLPKYAETNSAASHDTFVSRFI